MNYIDEAIKEAVIAYNEGNVPVGAVIVYDNKIIAKQHNTKNTTNISINHAEILAIKEACEYLNSWHLDDCEMYITLKPCEMCISAIAESRISKIYYLLDSNYEENLTKNKDKIEIIKLKDGDEQYNKLLSGFFNKIRN